MPIIGADLFQTFASVAGVKSQDLNASDGENILPVLLGQKNLKRDALYWHYPHYHPGGATPYSSIIQGHWKLIYFYETGKKELYNLKNGIGEKKICIQVKLNGPKQCMAN